MTTASIPHELIPGKRQRPLNLRSKKFEGLLSRAMNQRISISGGVLACPACGSRAASRSHRRTLEDWVVFWPLMMRPFRCRSCNTRYQAFWFRKAHSRKRVPHAERSAQ